MNQVISEFEDRVKELDLYFQFVENLEDSDAVLHLPKRKTHKYKKIDSAVVKMLKANAFLIMYNLVEASIRDGIVKIYDDLASNNHTYESVRKEIRDIWVKHHYRQIFNETASWESGRKIAAKLIDAAVNKAILDLDKEAAAISGNLDARQIRSICKQHGISHIVHRRAAGGENLVVVKNQRNALAHGDLSFAECGRQFTIEDLKTIKTEIVIYIRGILRNMKFYINKRLYIEDRTA